MVLSGVVDAGVEPGCIVLRSNGVTYELLTTDPGVHTGASVTVTGHLVTGIMSHCMQGRMFAVTTVSAR